MATFVTDLDGRQIEITDLDAAIAQVDEFVGYNECEEIKDAFIYKMHNYWLDLQKKLRKMK